MGFIKGGYEDDPNLTDEIMGEDAQGMDIGTPTIENAVQSGFVKGGYKDTQPENRATPMYKKGSVEAMAGDIVGRYVSSLYDNRFNDLSPEDQENAKTQAQKSMRYDPDWGKLPDGYKHMIEALAYKTPIDAIRGGMTPEQFSMELGGGLETPMIDPVDMLAWGMTGGGYYFAKQGVKTLTSTGVKALAKETIDWSLFGLPSLAKAAGRKGKDIVGGLTAKATEKTTKVATRLQPFSLTDEVVYTTTPLSKTIVKQLTGRTLVRELPFSKGASDISSGVAGGKQSIQQALMEAKQGEALGINIVRDAKKVLNTPEMIAQRTGKVSQTYKAPTHEEAVRNIKSDHLTKVNLAKLDTTQAPGVATAKLHYKQGGIESFNKFLEGVNPNLHEYFREAVIHGKKIPKGTTQVMVSEAKLKASHELLGLEYNGVKRATEGVKKYELTATETSEIYADSTNAMLKKAAGTEGKYLHSGGPSVQQLGAVLKGGGKAVKEKVGEALEGAYQQIGHADRVLGRHPAGERLWNYTYKADQAKTVFSFRIRDKFKKHVRFKTDSKEAMNVGKLLDTYGDLKDVPKAEFAKLSQVEKDAFVFMREQYSAMGDVLIADGLIKPGQKLKKYFFRIFPKEEFYEGWKYELANLQTAGKGATPRAMKLKNAIKQFDTKGTMLYDVIPTNMEVPFLKTRTGGKGYFNDSVNSFKLYNYYFERKIFDEPALKLAMGEMKNLPETLRPYAHKYLRRFIRMDKKGPADAAARFATSFQYFKNLGAFNARSALVNATQSLNTVIEIGPIWTSKASAQILGLQGKAAKAEANALWEASGHMGDVPGIYYRQMHKFFTKINDISMFLFNSIEAANRKIAYVGAYNKAISEGSAQVLAKHFADDVVRKTQFLYGRVGMPMLSTQSAPGKVAAQYTSFASGQIDMMVDWARNDPKKLIAYLIIAEGGSELLWENLSIDLGNALGTGLDYREVIGAIKAIGSGNKELAKFHVSQVVEPGGGIFPQSIWPPPVVDTAINVYNAGMEDWWVKLLPDNIARIMETTKALQMGKITTPTGDIGYPIETLEADDVLRLVKGEKPIQGRNLRYVESKTELFTRLFARPRKESISNKEANLTYWAQERTRKIADRALEMIIDGDLAGDDEAVYAGKKLLSDNQIPISEASVLATIFKRNLTVRERMILKRHIPSIAGYLNAMGVDSTTGKEKENAKPKTKSATDFYPDIRDRILNK